MLIWSGLNIGKANFAASYYVLHRRQRQRARVSWHRGSRSAQKRRNDADAGQAAQDKRSNIVAALIFVILPLFFFLVYRCNAENLWPTEKHSDFQAPRNRRTTAPAY